MAEALLNEIPVLRGTIALPRIGVWHADLLLDTDALVDGSVRIHTADDALDLRGTITRSGVVDGRVEVRVQGGAAAFSRIVAPKFYQAVPLRVPIADLMRETGEQLSLTSSAEVLDTTLVKWVRESASAATALTHLLRKAKAIWRVLADGTLWIGHESWPAVEVPGDVIEQNVAAGFVIHAADTIYGLLTPGTTWLDRRVSYVEHHIEEAATRTRVWFETENRVNADRPRNAFDALVAQITKQTLFHAMFPATVLQQDEDGTLQVQPDLEQLSPMVGVPIRTAAPGIALRVAPGSRVLLAFEEGDPSQPIATLWFQEDQKQASLRVQAMEGVTLQAARIHLGDHAERGVARTDDRIAVGTLSLAAAPSPGVPGTIITMSYTDAFGVLRPPVTLTLGGLVVGTILPPVFSITLEGKIVSGSERVRAD